MEDKSIQLQAIELELGDSFKELYPRVQSFVKSLIGKKHWWTNQAQLLECEGPLSKMTEHCLLYIIEEGDKEAGYRAYSAYLATEYGTGQARNARHEYDQTQESNRGHQRNLTQTENIEAPTTEPPDSSLIALVESKVLDRIKLSLQEQEFLVAGEKMGVINAGACMGWDSDTSWTKWRALQQKLRQWRKEGVPIKGSKHYGKLDFEGIMANR